jgi:uncharacterized protein YqjF (DUF2071 family)
MTPPRVSFRDGSYVIASITKDTRSIMAVRLTDGTFEVWSVLDGYIQAKVPTRTREDVMRVLDDWKPWLSGERPPESALH